MTNYILQVSIGPIQDFIKSARRTRDFWFGSHILSELSRIAAKRISEAGELIFPSFDKAEFNAALNYEGIRRIANIILAEVSDSDESSMIALCNSVRLAVESYWKSVAKDIFKQSPDLKSFVVMKRFEKQIEDVIEFYAAWSEISPNTPYSKARENVARAMAARKTIRDFTWHDGEHGIPKSSLDAARETVFIKDGDKTAFEILKEKSESDPALKGLRYKLRLSSGEALDAIGLVKRMAENKPYPSISRIAAQPWIRQVHSCPSVKPLLDSAIHLCGTYHADRTYSIKQIKEDQFELFPYETEMITEDGLENLTNETGLDFEDLKLTVEDIHKECKENGIGEPDRYVGIIQADGDKMGKTISNLETPEKNRAFSQALTRFSSKVKDIVAAHGGSLVYAGGDDVLAFVPVETCLACADKLRDEFQSCLGEFAGDTTSPSLSVGLAIGHCMTPMEDLLAYASQAEHHAKNPDRNGLAVHLHPRSGAPIKIRDQWSNNILDRLKTWIHMLQTDRLSDKTPYDLRNMAVLYESWSKPDVVERAIRVDVRRLLKKKRPGGIPMSDAEMDAVGDKIDEIIKTVLTTCRKSDQTNPYYRAVMQLAEEMLIARRIVQASHSVKKTEVTA